MMDDPEETEPENPTPLPITNVTVQDIYGYYGTSHANEGHLAWSATTPYSGSTFSAPSTDERTDYFYSSNHLLTSISYPVPEGQTVRPEEEFTWSGGQLTEFTNRLSHSITYSYDVLGRRIETLFSDGTKEQVYYDDVNRVVYRKNRTNIVSVESYGPSGRLTATYSHYGYDTDISDESVDDVHGYWDQGFTKYYYGPGVADVSGIDRNGSFVSIGRDYRGREILRQQQVRDLTLDTGTTYVNNQRFYTAEINDEHEVRTYYGYSADRLTVRTIQTREPGVTFADNAAVISATRQSGADPDHIINDAVRDIRGQIVQLVDPMGIESLTTYDALGRSLTQSRTKGSLELTSQSNYDHLGNVVETISETGLVTEMEYDPAGNLITRTVAPGSADELEWSYTYDFDNQVLTESAPGGAVTTHVRQSCCGLTTGTENALGHGTVVNRNASGQTVHTATLEDFDSHTNLLNPVDGKTLSEQTTRYGKDGKVQFRTVWKTALGAIDRNNPPIAGLDSVAVADGLTTQYVYIYFWNYVDSKTINRLGGGTASVNLTAAVNKLLDSIASGGTDIELGGACMGLATVAIAPDEKTMQVSMSDCIGRSLMQATMTGPAATTPNQLLNWSCTRYDDIDDSTNDIDTVMTRQIDPDGNVVASFTDGFGRTIATVDQLGKKSTSQYDSGGNLLKSINALNKETVYAYDDLGRQVTVTDPLSNVQTTVYDSDTGQVIERKDAKNKSTYFEYDDLGRQTEITDRLGKITTREYDSAGRLESITDAQSKTTSYEYNLLGQRTEVTLPDSTTKEFEYDPAGRLKKVIFESGISQTTVYEFSGVVDKIEYRNAGNTLVGTDDYTYNALLQRTGASGRYGSTQAWTYDDLGRMITEALTYNSQTYPVGYEYDSWGRLIEITYPSGRTAEYTFDERSALDTITWDSSEIEDRDYDDLGRLASVDRPGVDETRAYDDAGRLTSIANTNVGTGTYTYDANHNKLSESWSGAMAAWNFVTTNAGTYTDGYDHEDRFVHFAQSSQSKTFNFTRSDIGNITNVNLNGTGTSRGFNNIHALTSIGAASQTFDVDGNQTASYAGHTMTWDEAGMMKQSVVPTSPVVGVEGTNEYGYDADRKRIWKKITRQIEKDPPPTVVEHTVYIYAGPNCIAEYPSGTAAASPTQEYVYAQEIDSLVMLVRNGGSDNYAITRNQQWSVTALTNAANGTVLERYTYDHFGKRTILAPDGSTVRSASTYHMPYGYTSRRHDVETGMMYFRARYFDPHTAEFISPDPLEYVDGMSLFRGYFVGTNVDPSGERKVCCKLGYEGNKDNTWVREIECESGRSAHGCCSNVHGAFYNWTVYGSADRPCDRVSNPTSTGAGGVACCAFLIAIPTDPTDAVGTPGGVIVGVGAGVVWLCAASEIIKFPPIPIDIDIPVQPPRPIPDPDPCRAEYENCLKTVMSTWSGRQRNRCWNCYLACRAAGGIWSSKMNRLNCAYWNTELLPGE